MSEKEKINVYLRSPVGFVTGGIEFLHQVCHELNIYPEINARMFYETIETEPQAEIYTKRYGNEYVVNYIPKPGEVMIFPEVSAYNQYIRRPEFKPCLKIILWESVNFYLQTVNNFNLLNTWPPDCWHFTQSQYARDYLTFAKVQEERVFPLTDYISDEFFSSNFLANNRKQRGPLILFNPKKGFNFTHEVAKYEFEHGDFFKFAPLEGYSTEQLIEIMSVAAAYIDFGFHPGKDRLPREAILCGCPVITSLSGSARNNVDVPILEKYKMEAEIENIPKILDVIKDVYYNYDERIKDFEVYIEKVKKERDDFKRDVKKLAELIVSESRK